MLNLILGRAGSGKSTQLMGEIEKVTKAGGRAILLVPEQFSFESEKELFLRLGAANSSRTEVLSFSRLCNSIFREYGGLAGQELTETARYILMGIALDEVASQLTVFKGEHAKAGIIGQMVATVHELKTAGITPEAMLSAEPQSRSLYQKTQDIGLIYSAYQNLVESRFSDSDDAIPRALAKLNPKEFFGETTVFIDSFTAFMADEYSMLAAIVAGAKDIFAAFTCDNLVEFEGGMGVFSPAKQSASRLVRVANESAVDVAAPVVLGDCLRFLSADIAAIERSFLQERDDADFLHLTKGGVQLVSARDVYDECEFVAVEIAKSVREGVRYRDIAVICRDLKPYKTALPRVFGRFGIPFFMDTEVSAANTPVVAAVQSALDCVQHGFAVEDVLRFAKCTALGLDRQEAAELENYCYTWNTEKSELTTDFLNNPDGLLEDFTSEQRSRLSAINKTRAKVMEPLISLKNHLDGADGIAFATAINALLEEISAGEQIAEAAALFEDDRRAIYLDEQGAIWDAVMALLTSIAQVVGERGLTIQRFSELFTVGAGTIGVGQIPQTLDQVIVGMADRIRPTKVKHGYVIGAESGQFPAALGSTGLFEDNERRELLTAGLELAGTAEVQAVREKFYAYFAVTIPSQRLCISYCRSNLSGGQSTPSVIASEAREILGIPPITTDKMDWQGRVVNQKTALQELGTEGGAATVKGAVLAELVGKDEANSLKSRLAAVSALDFKIENPITSKELFGKSMKLSPSQIERYYSCAFSYFCAYGLRIKKRKKADFNPIESGVVTHLVLQILLERHGSKGLGAVLEKDLRDEIKGIIDSYLEGRIKDKNAMPKRFYYMYTRLVSSLLQLVRRLALEFAQSKFEPVAFELNIAEEAEPLHLVTADGTEVLVQGTVDRADIMEDESGKYLRIVDYKTGKKSFSLSDVVQGLNMQMLIYLFTLKKNGKGRLGGAIPAGVLYMPSASGFVTADRHENLADIEFERLKSYKMSGLLLDEANVIQGMEKELAGVFIPAKLKKDGSYDSYSSVATLAQLGKLEKRINKSITDMVELLGGGRIGALPIKTAENHQPCDYCEYSGVCGREENQPNRKIVAMKNSEVFAELEAEEEQITEKHENGGDGDVTE